MQSVLIVDDSALARTVIRRAIHACDVAYHVVEAKDGEDALEKLDSLPFVNLLITDLNMPRMGGEDLIKAVRERPIQPDKVVVISSSVSTVRKLRLLRLGVEHVIPKPFQPELLQQSLQPLLQAHTAAALPEDARTLLDAAVLDTLSQLVFRVAMPVDSPHTFQGTVLLGTVAMSEGAKGTLSVVADHHWAVKVSKELTGGEDVSQDFVGELANIVGGGIVTDIESKTGMDVALSAPSVRLLTDPVIPDRLYRLEDGSLVGLLWNVELPQLAEA